MVINTHESHCSYDISFICIIALSAWFFEEGYYNYIRWDPDRKTFYSYKYAIDIQVPIVGDSFYSIILFLFLPFLVFSLGKLFK